MREAKIRDWCRRTLVPVFGDATLEVRFACCVAYMRRALAGEGPTP